MIYMLVEVAHPGKTKVREQVKLLVDSGALYSVIPRTIITKLHIRPHGKETFLLANGEQIDRDIADGVFFYKDKRGPSKVIIGEPGDSALMGVVTLESLGYALDPLRRELKPLKMLLV